VILTSEIHPGVASAANGAGSVLMSMEWRAANASAALCVWPQFEFLRTFPRQSRGARIQSDVAEQFLAWGWRVPFALVSLWSASGSTSARHSGDPCIAALRAEVAEWHMNPKEIERTSASTAGEQIATF